MATLILQHHSDGTTRRCDARCYNAKGAKCTCVCGGSNHGVGYQKAHENTVKMAEAMLEDCADKGVKYAKEILDYLRKEKAANG